MSRGDQLEPSGSALEDIEPALLRRLLWLLLHKLDGEVTCTREEVMRTPKNGQILLTSTKDTLTLMAIEG